MPTAEPKIAMTISTSTTKHASEIAPSADQLAGVLLKAGEQVADLERLPAPHRVAAEHEAAGDHRHEQRAQRSSPERDDAEHDGDQHPQQKHADERAALLAP